MSPNERGPFMTTTAKTGEHIGLRPTWDCRVCAQPWPCAIAKDGLRAEFQGFPSVMSIYMSAQMFDAARDFMAEGAGPPPDLYERFLAWIRPQAPPGPAARRSNRGPANHRDSIPPPLSCTP
jgi:hypothetical protein